IEGIRDDCDHGTLRHRHVGASQTQEGMAERVNLVAVAVGHCACCGNRIIPACELDGHRSSWRQRSGVVTLERRHCRCATYSRYGQQATFGKLRRELRERLLLDSTEYNGRRDWLNLLAHQRRQG